MKKRGEVSLEDRWNVEALFADPTLWEEAFSSFDFSPLKTFQGQLQKGPLVLKDLFETLFALSRQLDKLHTYAHLRHDEDVTDHAHKLAYQKTMMVACDFQQACSWIEPEILALPAATLQTYLQDLALAPYRFYLEKIVRLQPHTLSEQEEKLLAMASQPLHTASKAFGALNNADIKFGKVKDQSEKEHELSHGSYQLYLRSPDRTLREHAFVKLHQSFENVENTLAELLYGQVQNHVFQAKARSYSTSLHAALYPKNIPTSVYHNLIHTVRAHLPSLHRYVRLRKKILQLQELHCYDLYVPLVTQEQSVLSYKEGEQLVIDSVAPLGREYQQLLRQGLQQEHWVDRFENQNKRSGAYSSGCYDSYPYILMNYKGILRDVFTLAHEAGHSMHSLLSHQTQPYHDSHYPIFVAEVASTFNEELLMHLLLSQKITPEQRLYLINEKVEDIRTTLFRQTMFAEFELMIHQQVEQGIPLTPGLLKELYLQLNGDYFGPDLILDPLLALEWSRIPHFYYNFYVYQYATGISAALALAEPVLHEDKHAVTAYLNFLQGGGHLFPVDLLKLAGIDMTSPAPIEAALKKFDSLVTELEQLLTQLAHKVDKC